MQSAEHEGEGFDGQTLPDHAATAWRSAGAPRAPGLLVARFFRLLRFSTPLHHVLVLQHQAAPVGQAAGPLCVLNPLRFLHKAQKNRPLFAPLVYSRATCLQTSRLGRSFCLSPYTHCNHCTHVAVFTEGMPCKSVVPLEESKTAWPL